MKHSKDIFLMGLLLCGSSTLAHAQSPWMVRLRAIDVIPQASSNQINIVGGQVNEMSTEVVPELDVNYFFTKNVAAELILGTMRHSVAANSTVLGHVDLGRASLLPPTVTLQYHFVPDAMFSPYIGAGLNYTYFYNISNGPLSTSTSYGSSFGPALQAGVDLNLNPHWSLNLDVKKIFIQTNASVNTPVGQLNPTVKLNPFIIGLGVGYKI